MLQQTAHDYDYVVHCTTYLTFAKVVLHTNLHLIRLLTLGWTENWASIVQENEFRTHWLHLGMRRRLAYMARLASVKFNSDEYNMNHTL